MEQYVLHVIITEFADKKVIKELGLFNGGNVQGYFFRPQKDTNPQNKRFGVLEFCMELFGTVDVCIKVSFKTFFQKI